MQDLNNLVSKASELLILKLEPKAPVVLTRRNKSIYYGICDILFMRPRKTCQMNMNYIIVMLLYSIAFYCITYHYIAIAITITIFVTIYVLNIP